MDKQREFFRLPMESKMTILQDSNNRGYTPYRESTLDPDGSKHPDTHEGLYFGREVSADSEEGKLPLHGPNQWPAEDLLPGYRAATWAYYEALTSLMKRALPILALSLGLERTHFDTLFERPIATLRPLHYRWVKALCILVSWGLFRGRHRIPEMELSVALLLLLCVPSSVILANTCYHAPFQLPSADPARPEEGQFSAGAHSDYGCLTFLLTDGTPGLQIFLDDQWNDVPWVPGTIVVNLGDMLERWTGGQYHSTVHRVVNTSGRERFSAAFFVEPNFETVVDVFPQASLIA